jgi:hypothetical protein
MSGLPDKFVRKLSWKRTILIDQVEFGKIIGIEMTELSFVKVNWEMSDLWY